MSKHRAEVAFPQAGEGVYFKYTLRDMAALQDALGGDYVTEIWSRLNRWDAKVMALCLTHGLKKDGKPFDVDLDNLSFTFVEAIDPILNAQSLFRSGKTLNELVKQQEVQEPGAADAPEGPTTSSSEPLKSDTPLA